MSYSSKTIIRVSLAVLNLHCKELPKGKQAFRYQQDTTKSL